MKLLVQQEQMMKLLVQRERTLTSEGQQGQMNGLGRLVPELSV